jgi:hypothetical protein
MARVAGGVDLGGGGGFRRPLLHCRRRLSPSSGLLAGGATRASDTELDATEIDLVDEVLAGQAGGGGTPRALPARRHRPRRRALQAESTRWWNRALVGHWGGASRAPLLLHDGIGRMLHGRWRRRWGSRTDGGGFWWRSRVEEKRLCLVAREVEPPTTNRGLIPRPTRGGAGGGIWVPP